MMRTSLLTITLGMLFIAPPSRADQPATPPAPPSYSRLAMQFSGLVNRFSDVTALRKNTLLGERARYLKHIARTHATYAALLNGTDRLKFLLADHPKPAVQQELSGLRSAMARDVKEDLKQVTTMVPTITNDSLRGYAEELGAGLDQFIRRLEASP